jgi:phosphotransferase system HPr-like phosphotransfer protein
MVLMRPNVKLTDTILVDFYEGWVSAVSVQRPVGRARRGKATMEIVGTVDSRYKLIEVRSSGSDETAQLRAVRVREA